MNAIGWAHAGPSMVAAFLASLVEFVEALTVVLAVGTVRGWRHALAGTALGLLSLLALVVALGPALTRAPLGLLQLVIGTLLLLFGLRWLRKAVLRSADVIALHDEAAAFADEAALMRRERGVAAPGGWDRVAIAAAFQIVVLEGLEVVFIVVAVGAVGGLVVPAAAGAAAALLLVLLLGALLRRPLARVPENLLKFTVGVLLSAFGTFWLGEGIGLAWPGDDWSLPALLAAYLATALVLVPVARALHAVPRPSVQPTLAKGKSP